MKRRFATKLILSGAALAVSAATLVSTTYAWYVQNSQVTATGVKGVAKDNEASSIYISKAVDLSAGKIDATWSSSVELAAGEYVNDGLTPVTLTGSSASAAGTFKDVNDNDVTSYTETNAFVYGGTYYTKPSTEYVKAFTIEIGKTYYKDSGHTEVATAFLAGNSYYNGDGSLAFAIDANPTKYYTLPTVSFTLYVMATTNTNVRPYIIVTNNSTVNNQTAYRNISMTGTDVATTDAFWVDALQALRMQIAVQKSDTTNKKWDDASFANYDLFDVAKSAYDGTSIYTDYVYNTKAAGLNETEFADEDFYDKATTYSSTETYYVKSGNSYVAADPQPADQTAITNGNYFVKSTLKGANAYYRGLVGSAPEAGFKETATLVNPTDSKKINKYELEAGQAYKFTFTIWLEGTDISCFDVCAKQLFDFVVNFDVE